MKKTLLKTKKIHFLCKWGRRRKWFSALAALAMLSAETWVGVLPTTSGVFFSATRFLRSTIKSQRYHLCHASKLSSPRLLGVACKTSKRKTCVWRNIIKEKKSFIFYMWAESLCNDWFMTYYRHENKLRNLV